MTIDDALLSALAAEAGSAVVSDACDLLGIRTVTADLQLRRLSSGPPLVGFARPVRVVDVEAAPERPYGQEIDFIDSLSHRQVPVISAPTTRAACWGELFSTAAKGRGANGAVVDGAVRDSRRIDSLGWPVFTRGVRPADSLGRVSMTAPDQPVEIGGLVVHTGDLVIADDDGLTVVPSAIWAQVAQLALEKARTETSARELLLGGATLRQAWERFRVL
jgi:regulator of RNase E activity RraA